MFSKERGSRTHYSQRNAEDRQRKDPNALICHVPASSLLKLTWKPAQWLSPVAPPTTVLSHHMCPDAKLSILTILLLPHLPRESMKLTDTPYPHPSPLVPAPQDVSLPPSCLGFVLWPTDSVWPGIELSTEAWWCHCGIYRSCFQGG